MKKMKRLVALALSVVMVLAMSVVAFADDSATTTTYTISVPDTDSHEYEIYQIFTGDLADGVLSNVKWGANAKSSYTVGDAVDSAILKELTDVSGKSDREILNVVEKYADLTGTPAGTAKKGSSCQVKPGYYLIKDKDNTVSGTDTYTTYIVKVVDNVTIARKADSPSFEKKIKDTNDTTGDTSTWQDSADYDIGDQVPFKLEGTVASNYNDYKTYYFAFHDKEETGLTFNASSVKVYVDGQRITSGYDVVTDPTDDCTFEVVFSNLKGIDAVKAGSKITVEYTSELNTGAVLGNHGNVNMAKLEFSNNPNEEQNGSEKPGTGETPWDNVIVFTYKVVVNKVDEKGNALAGAEFTLKKNIKDENGDVTGTETVAVVKNTEGTIFTFNGLDDGEYVLEETKTPQGYNTISAITFTVDANHNITWDGTNRDSVLQSLAGNKVTGKISFTKDEAEGSLTTTVENKKVSSLPSTGGIGTTIFYVVGGILMVGAAVLLITKRRAEN